MKDTYLKMVSRILQKKIIRKFYVSFDFIMSVLKLTNDNVNKSEIMRKVLYLLKLRF